MKSSNNELNFYKVRRRD